MNQTDEYLLQTFEQANEGFSETVADVWAEVAQRPEEDVADKDLVFMDRLLEVTGFPKESLVEYLAGELGMEPAELSEVNPTEEALAVRLRPEPFLPPLEWAGGSSGMFSSMELRRRYSASSGIHRWPCRVSPLQ